MGRKTSEEDKRENVIKEGRWDGNQIKGTILDRRDLIITYCTLVITVTKHIH